jgi:ABC-2 type transport system permease protein
MLQDMIGEAKVNNALSRFCKKYAFGAPPYPISTDLIAYFDEEIPDSISYLSNDLFKRIIVFDYGIKAVKSSQSGKNWLYTIKMDNIKQETVKGGKLIDSKFNDWVEIAMYEKGKDKPYYIKKHLITDKDQVIKISLPKKLVKVEIDPKRMVIDRYKDNNSKEIQ